MFKLQSLNYSACKGVNKKGSIGEHPAGFSTAGALQSLGIKPNIIQVKESFHGKIL